MSYPEPYGIPAVRAHNRPCRTHSPTSHAGQAATAPDRTAPGRTVSAGRFPTVFVHRLHTAPELVKPVAAQDGARGAEHVSLFFFDVVLEALLQDLERRAPSLVARVHLLQLGHQHISHMVFLVSLEDDGAGFMMALQCRIENFLFFPFMRRDLSRER